MTTVTRPSPARRDLISKLSDRLEPSRVPSAPAPMFCTLVDSPFDDPRWIFEPKFDGLRVLVRFDGRKLSLISRNNKEQNLQFPDVLAPLRASLAAPAVLDGEIVCFDDAGRTSFRDLQQRFHLEDVAEIERRAEKYPASIYLFDLLYVDRFNVTGLPLEDRKAILREAVRWSDRVLWTEFERGKGLKPWRRACENGEEGIVAKRIDSKYVAGRSDAWVKVKCIGRQEFVIGGWTDPQRSRVGLGALLVGYYSDDGKTFIYAGKVGTGYTREALLELRKRLDAIGQTESPFERGDPPRGERVHWVRPRLVAEIAFGEWTQNGLLRQPRFEGMREDKSPRECRREWPKSSRKAKGKHNHTD